MDIDLIVTFFLVQLEFIAFLYGLYKLEKMIKEEKEKWLKNGKRE